MARATPTWGWGGEQLAEAGRVPAPSALLASCLDPQAPPPSSPSSLYRLSSPDRLGTRDSSPSGPTDHAGLAPPSVPRGHSAGAFLPGTEQGALLLSVLPGEQTHVSTSPPPQAHSASVLERESTPRSISHASLPRTTLTSSLPRRCDNEALLRTWRSIS